MSEYLPDEVAASLRQYLNLPEDETQKRKLSMDKAGGKRAKLDPVEQGRPGVLDLTQAKKPSRGPSAKEKSQMKAASGSKPITSFFKKK